MATNFANEGLHHGKAVRPTRKRDGFTWDPDGEVNAKQFGGHDGGKSGKVGKHKAVATPKGAHPASN